MFPEFKLFLVTVVCSFFFRMSSMDSTVRRGRVAEEQVLLNEIPSRNGVSITPTRTPIGKRGNS